jgi:hypothetical protein
MPRPQATRSSQTGQTKPQTHLCATWWSARVESCVCVCVCVRERERERERERDRETARQQKGLVLPSDTPPTHRKKTSPSLRRTWTCWANALRSPLCAVSLLALYCTLLPCAVLLAFLLLLLPLLGSAPFVSSSSFPHGCALSLLPPIVPFWGQDHVGLQEEV